MGGTYELSGFEDRLSQYPSRRKLIHNAGDEENVYTVQRDEGTIYKEGIAFSADMMNTFDRKISDMFPVSLDNGGTGATSANVALKNLGLEIKTGSWTPQPTCVRTDEGQLTIPTITTEYCTAKYYTLGDICYVSFHGKWVVANAGVGYAVVDGLPFSAGGGWSGQALAIHELYGGIDEIPDGSRPPDLLHTTCTAIVQDGTPRLALYGRNGSLACEWKTGTVQIGCSGIYCLTSI